MPTAAADAPAAAAPFLFVVRPLSVAVWLLLIVAFASVTGVVHLTDRLQASVPAVIGAAAAAAGGSRQSLQSSMVADSVWTVLSTMLLVRSASEIDRPRTVSARLATGALAVFSLGVLVSYAVNMAAMRLSATTTVRPSFADVNLPSLIHRRSSGAAGTRATSTLLHDLVLQRNDVELVALTDDVTTSLVDGSADSDAAVLRRRLLWAATAVGVAPPVGADPLERLTAAIAAAADPGRVVAVGDSSTTRYAAMRDCSLVELEVLAETTLHAFGLERRSTLLRQQINAVLLMLAEQGVVKQLQNK